LDAATIAMGRMNIGPPHPTLRSAASAPSAPGRGPQLGLGGLAARRAGAQAPKLHVTEISRDLPLHLPPGGGPSGAGLGGGRPQMDDGPRRSPQATWGTPFANFGRIVYVFFFFLSQLMFNLTLSPSDPSGALNFAGKAVLHAQGVDFTNGSSFAINMTQLQLEEELGRGNYGTVKKVLHKPTKVHMAMKASVFISFPAPTISFPHRRSVLN
jgi:mitogen-activated protein kinase kinase